MIAAKNPRTTLGLALLIPIGLAAQSVFEVVEWHAMSQSTKQLGASVALVAKTPNDVFVVNGVSHLNTSPLRKVCPAAANNDPVFDQPSRERCTAFLVAPDRVVTAGHCVQQAMPATCVAGASATNLRFVFDFRMTGSTTASTPATDDIYSGTKVIGCRNNGANDWAVIQLDRAVTGRTPLKVDGGALPVKDSPVSYIGHPLGLPLKLLEGVVLEPHTELSFRTSLKSTRGSSGSPVFDSTGKVVGLVQRTIVPKGGPGICLRLRPCQGPQCVTTIVTRASLFETAISK